MLNHLLRKIAKNQSFTTLLPLGYLGLALLLAPPTATAEKPEAPTVTRLSELAAFGEKLESTGLGETPTAESESQNHSSAVHTSAHVAAVENEKVNPELTSVKRGFLPPTRAQIAAGDLAGAVENTDPIRYEKYLKMCEKVQDCMSGAGEQSETGNRRSSLRQAFASFFNLFRKSRKTPVSSGLNHCIARKVIQNLLDESSSQRLLTMTGDEFNQNKNLFKQIQPFLNLPSFATIHVQNKTDLATIAGVFHPEEPSTDEIIIGQTEKIAGIYDDQAKIIHKILTEERLGVTYERILTTLKRKQRFTDALTKSTQIWDSVLAEKKTYGQSVIKNTKDLQKLNDDILDLKKKKGPLNWLIGKRKIGKLQTQIEQIENRIFADKQAHAATLRKSADEFAKSYKTIQDVRAFTDKNPTEDYKKLFDEIAITPDHLEMIMHEQDALPGGKGLYPGDMTPLMLVVMNAKIENENDPLLPVLERHLDNINAKDAEGRTALYYAASPPPKDFMIQWLKERGGDPDLADKKGVSPKSMFYIEYFQQLLKALIPEDKPAADTDPSTGAKK